MAAGATIVVEVGVGQERGRYPCAVLVGVVIIDRNDGAGTAFKNQKLLGVLITDEVIAGLESELLVAPDQVDEPWPNRDVISGDVVDPPCSRAAGCYRQSWQRRRRVPAAGCRGRAVVEFAARGILRASLRVCPILFDIFESRKLRPSRLAFFHFTALDSDIMKKLPRFLIEYA